MEACKITGCSSSGRAIETAFWQYYNEVKSNNELCVEDETACEAVEMVQGKKKKRLN